jgi:hypothetical protein
VPRVVLVVLLALICGCGGSDERTAATPTPSATAKASPAAKAEGGLERFSFNGFSMLVPAGWKKQTDKDGVIFGAPNDEGAVGFYVMDSTYTAPEYVKRIILSGEKTRVLERDRIAVKGVGTGIAVRTTQSKTDKQGWWQLIAATIDGQLVDIAITPSPHLTDEQVDQMLHSVEREA